MLHFYCERTPALDHPDVVVLKDATPEQQQEQRRLDGVNYAAAQAANQTADANALLLVMHKRGNGNITKDGLIE